MRLWGLVRSMAATRAVGVVATGLGNQEQGDDSSQQGGPRHHGGSSVEAIDQGHAWQSGVFSTTADTGSRAPFGQGLAQISASSISGSAKAK